MARQVLGALNTLNLSTNLDPMFLELYTALGGDFSASSSFVYGNGSGSRSMQFNSGAGAAEGSSLLFRRNGSNSIEIGEAGRILGSGGADLVTYTYGSTNQRFYTNGAERMRIDSAGNVGIGISPTYRLDLRAPTGVLAYFRDSTTGGYIAAQSDASGPMLSFGNGSIGFRLADGSTERLRCDSTTGHFGAGADNAQTWGQASRRWSVVYAGTGTINTSDAREKTAVHDLDTDELDCAMALSKEIGSFKFLSAVAQKNAGARLHIGMTVQRAMEVMESFGLDPLRYAFICHDEWPAEHDEEGKETKPAGDRYGFRADELGLFIMRGLAARLDALEG